MRVAVVGSRGVHVADVGLFLPSGTSCIVSGGARGVDTSARQWAVATGVPLLEFLPDYRRWGRSAPLRRNETILAHAEYAVIFWDGRSRGTAYMIRRCLKTGMAFRLIIMQDKENSAV